MFQSEAFSETDNVRLPPIAQDPLTGDATGLFWCTPAGSNRMAHDAGQQSRNQTHVPCAHIRPNDAYLL